MKNYNIFKTSIPDKYQRQYECEKAQTKILLEASNLIYKAMEEKKLNQSELAKKLGVSRGYISKILSGDENMSLKNLVRILFELDKKYIQDIKNIDLEETDCDIFNFADFQKDTTEMKLSMKTGTYETNKTNDIEAWSH